MTPSPIDRRLDESAWYVFGRRFPRRFSLYARVLAACLLLLFLGWWFTRDVTYVSNVKVAGLDSLETGDTEALRSLATDFADMVNRLADMGYGWQSGGLPTLRAGEALTDDDPAPLVALGSLEIRKGGASLTTGPAAEEFGTYLGESGWDMAPQGTAPGASKVYGTLRATIRVLEAAEGRERMRIEVTRD